MPIKKNLSIQCISDAETSCNPSENDLRYLMGEVVDMLERAGASMPDQQPQIMTRYCSDGSVRVSAPVTHARKHGNTLASLTFLVEQIIRIRKMKANGVALSVKVRPARTSESFIVTLALAASH